MNTESVRLVLCCPNENGVLVISLFFSEKLEYSKIEDDP